MHMGIDATVKVVVEAGEKEESGIRGVGIVCGSGWSVGAWRLRPFRL